MIHFVKLIKQCVIVQFVGDEFSLWYLLQCTMHVDQDLIDIIAVVAGRYIVDFYAGLLLIDSNDGNT